MQILRRSLLSLLAASALTAQVGLIAQSPAPGKAAAAAPAKIPALFLSDIHLDPFADPGKAARLNAAPATEWPAILSAPDSPTQAKEIAALQEACPTRGIDTPYVLWQSGLTAIRADAARARFITLSGDLLAHSFDCKYKALLPTATPAQFLDFTEKTVRTIVTTLRAALPGVPLYLAMGNNDSGCGDYQLDAAHDAFLGYTAKVVAESLSASLFDQDRAAVLSDFAAGGYYSVPLAGVPHTRLLVLDDRFLRQLLHLLRPARPRTGSRATGMARRAALLRAPAQRARRRRGTSLPASISTPPRATPPTSAPGPGRGCSSPPNRSPSCWRATPTWSGWRSSATPTTTRCAC